MTLQRTWSAVSTVCAQAFLWSAASRGSNASVRPRRRCSPRLSAFSRQLGKVPPSSSLSSQCFDSSGRGLWNLNIWGRKHVNKGGFQVPHLLQIQMLGSSFSWFTRASFRMRHSDLCTFLLSFANLGVAWRSRGRSCSIFRLQLGKPDTNEEEIYEHSLHDCWQSKLSFFFIPAFI